MTTLIVSSSSSPASSSANAVASFTGFGSSNNNKMSVVPKTTPSSTPTPSSMSMNTNNKTKKNFPTNITAAEASRKELAASMKRKAVGGESQPQNRKTKKIKTTSSTIKDNKENKKSSNNNNNPIEYVKSTLQKNGLNIDQASSPSFLNYIEPTQQMIDSFKVEIATAVRQNDIEQLRKLLLCNNNTKNDNDENEVKSSSNDTAKPKLYHCCNKFGESLIHMACRRGHMEMVRFLIDELKAPLLVKDDFGRTPLHDTFWTPQPHYELVKYIISKKPELLCVPDVRGHLPLNYAPKRHWNDWNTFFQKHHMMLRPTTTTETSSSSQ